MKATGVIRKLDQLGRIVFPIELRRNLNMNEGDSIEIFVEGDNIILKKYTPGCHCCGEVSNLTNILGLDICPKCLEEFEKAAALTNKLRKEG